MKLQIEIDKDLVATIPEESRPAFIAVNVCDYVQEHLKGIPEEDWGSTLEISVEIKEPSIQA